jgi:DNA-binding transcriptional regulator YhcF (GntR family)
VSNLTEAFTQLRQLAQNMPFPGVEVFGAALDGVGQQAAGIVAGAGKGQVVNAIHDARNEMTGDWAELPLIRDISAAFGRSHTTVSVALRALADRGLIRLDRARWIVVAPDQPAPSPPEPLADRIAGRIESGEWAVLPRLADIAAVFHCAPATVSSALRELVGRGVVDKDHARGSSGRWIVAAAAGRGTTPRH